MHEQNLITILQASLTPVILISGVGLLLLNMVHRIARPVDRIRYIAKEMMGASEKDKPLYHRQVQILYKRCLNLKRAITFSVLAISCVSIMILMIFLMTTFSLNISILIEIVFLCAIVAFVISLIIFLTDIHVSLKSLQIEMERLNIN